MTLSYIQTYRTVGSLNRYSISQKWRLFKCYQVLQKSWHYANTTQGTCNCCTHGSFSFFKLQQWDSNSGPQTCLAGNLLSEPHWQPFSFIFSGKVSHFCPGLASDCNSPNYSLPSYQPSYRLRFGLANLAGLKCGTSWFMPPEYLRLHEAPCLDHTHGYSM
jgi:hypothetical protein